MILLYAVFGLLGIFIVFLKYSFWRKKYSRLMPGKEQWFFNVFGDLIELLSTKDVPFGIMDFLQKRAELFQNEKIFCIWAAYLPFVFFVRSDVVKELLKNNKLNDKSWVYEWIQPLLGKGLITSSYEVSKPRRKALAPCFYSDVMKSFLPVFGREAQKLVNFLQKETKNDFIYIAEPISLCAVDITCETIFGITIDALKNENLEASESFSRASSIFMTKVISPWHWIDFIFQHTKMGKEFRHHCDVLQQVTRNLINEKKTRYQTGGNRVQVRKHKALMELLMDSNELGEKEIDEEMDTFALAESSRLYPSVSLFARQVAEETKISGYTIPKGASCVVFTYWLHRDPEIFPDPEKFDPDRFLPENRIKIPEYAFVPFSVGPRSCIGFKFAEIESKAILIQILRNFTIKSLDERHKIKLMLTPTLHPHTPILIRIRSRFDS